MDSEHPLNSEATLLLVTGFLEPFEVWKLNCPSAKLRGTLTPNLWEQLRKCWDLTALPCLVELVRGADPSMGPKEQASLLRMVGAWLLADPSCISLFNAAGQSAISWASDYGLTDVLRLLLSRLAFANNCMSRTQLIHSKETNGWYPLYRAAWNGRDDCARVLLAARAHPEGIEGGRYSPLVAAARWGHVETVAALLQARADANKKNLFGESALMLARSQGHQAVVNLLLECDKPREGGPYTGSTVLPVELPEDQTHAVMSKRHTLGQGWWNLGSEFYVNGESELPVSAFARVG
eukprot:TRINITY_DN48524_c0_g1_i1.p1 TRINITY_DN48524_c0_g1~~TRINITY_DN48524_c0_g1_i1.p1  ORF type:complete len:311 (-),score=50.07 TRINITY_DN48524_c0_g1_i1:36-917(-)